MIFAVIVVGTALVTLLLLYQKKLRHSVSWQATVTPLASIVGSGFLVATPLLAHEVGYYALPVMAGLILFAYWIGGALRFNIAAFTNKRVTTHISIMSMERLSKAVVAFAYFISVTYYLQLLAYFILKNFASSAQILANSITTVILAILGGIGFLWGLGRLERLEKTAVNINLAVIAAALAGFLYYNAMLIFHGNWQLPDTNPAMNWHSLQVVLGMLIVVQGFETSRFMGDSYSPKMRIRTMRHAQLIAGGIYLAFFAVSTVLFGLSKNTGVTAIVDMARVITPLLPIMIMIGALGSQFSASVADSIGAAGLMHEITHKTIKIRHIYPFIALVCTAITWTSNVMEIISYASRAFALYYFLQCCITLMILRTTPKVSHRFWKISAISVPLLFCLAVVIFGIPMGS